LENAFLDIGVRSRKEALDKGVSFLDPVTPQSEIHPLAGGQISGYALGTKAGAAALLFSALSSTAAKEKFGRQTVFVWLAQSRFLRRISGASVAVGALRAQKKLNAARVVVIGVYPCFRDVAETMGIGRGPVIVTSEAKKSKLASALFAAAEESHIRLQKDPGFKSPLILPFSEGDTDVVGLFLPVKFSATPSEVIDLSDVKNLCSLLQAVVQKRREL
jgi:putative aminopeptidase FrvX